MKIVSIIGGTGRLGAPVAIALQQAGFRVRILTRNPDQARQQLGEAFEYARADILDRASLASALHDTDFIHINVSGHSKQSYYEQHVRGTENVLAALGAQTIECISMISSASAYPEFDDRYDNRYKLEAEMLLKASGRPYLAFLPSWFMETLPMFVQKDRLTRIGPSNQAVHWVTARDYAKVVADAYKDPAQRNKRISVYGPEGITMADAFRQFAEHNQLKETHLPVWLAKVIGTLTRDETLTDVADLMAHYDRTGEKKVPDIIRTPTTFKTWLATSGAVQ
jgi:uncharacterized protein YbjT (DUF2867 family)